MNKYMKHPIRMSMEGEGDESEETMELLETDSVSPKDDAFVPLTEYDNAISAERALESLGTALESYRGSGLSEVSSDLIVMTIQRAERLSGLKYSGESLGHSGAIGTLLALAGVREFHTTVTERRMLLERTK